ncbi:MAG: hypothetical protein JSV56_11750 [Methanomassiliicoccales archaeon]|nr:MAG: hypothetical protein JSV56_11750 [Methanomassiliicoccales archaeon]
MMDPFVYWRFIGLAFYAISILLALNLLIWKGKFKVLNKIYKLVDWINGNLKKWNLKHIVVISMIFFAVFAAVHYITIDAAPDYYEDALNYYVPSGEHLISGENPYSNLTEAEGIKGGISHGILFPLINGIGVLIGDLLGVAIVWSFIGFLIPSLVYLLCKEYIKDNLLRVYAALLSIFIPGIIFFDARYIQDDLFIVPAIFIPLLLLKKERFIEAGIMAGVLGHLKYISVLVFSLILFALIISDKRVQKSVRRYFHCAIFLAISYLIIFLLTYFLYGFDFYQRAYLYILTGRDATAFISFSLFGDIGLFGVIIIMAIICLFPVFFKIKTDCIGLSVFIICALALVIPLFNYEQMVWLITPLLIYLMHRFQTSYNSISKLILLSPFSAIALSALTDVCALVGAFGDDNILIIIKITFTCSIALVLLHMGKYLKINKGPS